MKLFEVITQDRWMYPQPETVVVCETHKDDVENYAEHQISEAVIAEHSLTCELCGKGGDK